MLGFHAPRHGQVKTLKVAGLPDGVIAARLGHNETVVHDTCGVPHDSEQQTPAEVMARLRVFGGRRGT